MMEHQTKTGESKVVAECSYPLTGIACVARIYTDLAVMEVSPQGLLIREMVPGLSFDALQARTGATLTLALL